MLPQSVLPVQLGDQRQSERGKKRKTGTTEMTYDIGIIAKALAVIAQSRFERLRMILREKECFGNTKCRLRKRSKQ